MIASLIASAALASSATAAGPSGPDVTSNDPRRQQVAPNEIARVPTDRIEVANFEVRRVTFRMPELSVPLSENGPRLLVGAFGGRGPGMPKLAHIGIGWSF